MKFKKIASAVLGGVAMLAAGSASAVTFPDFVVNPAPYYAALPFTADKLTGNYDEVISFPTATTFDVSLKFQAGQFVANDGSNPLSAGRTGLGVGYNLYALFLGSGTITTAGLVTTLNLNPGGSLNLYIDPGVNTALETTFTAPADGTTPYIRGAGTFADDVQIVLNAVASSGQGKLDLTLTTCDANPAGGSGINCGSFGQTNNFPLTAAGMLFFVNPTPFYNLAFESGQLNNFDVGGRTKNVNGSLDLVFQTVPEPASIALVGLSLLGLCFVQRRKS